jgi:hypothetical protein
VITREVAAAVEFGQEIGTGGAGALASTAAGHEDRCTDAFEGHRVGYERS